MVRLKRNCGFASVIPRIIAVATLLGMVTFVDATAQENAATEGVVRVVNWPESRPPLEDGRAVPRLDYADYDLLPFLDSLRIAYRFEEEGGRPNVFLTLEWFPGRRGVLNGRVVRASLLPDDIRIESIDLLASVIADGRVAASFYVPLDTIDLASSPSMTTVEIRGVSWNSLFTDVDESARDQLRGLEFTLEAPRILRIVFAVPPEAARRPGRRGPYVGPDRTECIPDVGVWISIRGGHRWPSPPRRATRAERERRGEMARGGLVDRTGHDRGYDRDRARDPGDSGRTTRGDEDGDGEQASGRERTTDGKRNSEPKSIKLPKKKDNDDDDDDDRLFPAAIAGAAAVGTLAYLAGTGGYFGSVDKAPMGLMSGYVERRGGVLLHVAINPQVFGSVDGPENLIAGFTGFYDVFQSPVQPSLSVGVRITEEDSETATTKPSVAAGVVGNFGEVVVLAGYDFFSPDVRIGVAYNFRGRRR